MFKRNLNMFLELRGSCDQNIKQAGTTLTIVMWSQIFARVASFGIRQRILPNLYFWYLFTKIYLRNFNAKTSHSKKTSENTLQLTVFFPCFTLCFCVETLGRLETCLNCVSTFWFIFPGGLRPKSTIIWYKGILCCTVLCLPSHPAHSTITLLHMLHFNSILHTAHCTINHTAQYVL